MFLVLLNCALESAKNGTFYVMWTSSQLKKDIDSIMHKTKGGIPVRREETGCQGRWRQRRRLHQGKVPEVGLSSKCKRIEPSPTEDWLPSERHI